MFDLLFFDFVVRDICVINAVCDGFSLNCGKYNVLAVGYDDRACLSAAGNVYNASAVLGVLNKSFDGGGVGADDGNYSVSRYHVSKAYVYKLHIFVLLWGLLDVLYLLAYLFDIALDIYHELCDCGILTF